MKTINYALFFPKKDGSPGSVSAMCSFSVPDNIDKAQVITAFRTAFHAAIEVGFVTGNANAAIIIGTAMKTVDSQFGGTSFLLVGDAAEIIPLN